MVFPNSNNNAYLSAQSADNKPIITFSKKDEQVLIVDNPTDVACNIDVLASAFNKSIVKFNDTQKEVIDAFPVDGMVACLVDNNFFQVYDDLFTFREFTNGLGLYRNTILHIWQTLGYSILTNAVCFMVSADMNSDGDIADEYTVTYTLKTGVSSTNKRKTVLEGTTYKTTLKGVKGTDTVTVTVGGVTDADAYDSDTGVVKISKVEGNIVITVA
jgi:hypothetical protein